MKKHLFRLLLLLLPALSGQAQTFLKQPITFDLNGVSTTGRIYRNYSQYPATVQGDSLVKKAVESGLVSVTITSGVRANQIVTAYVTSPPANNTTTTPTTPTVTVPGWLSPGWDYSYVGGVLKIRGTSGTGKMSFARPDGQSFAVKNPDQITINSGTFYDPATISEGSFVRKWEINWSGIPIRLTAQQTNATATYSVDLNPLSGAQNQSLIGGTTTGPPSVTTTPPSTTTIAVSYPRVLAVGNSITTHGGTPEFVVNDANPARGMAATRPEFDYVRLLTAKHKIGNPSVDFRTLATFNMGGTLDMATGPYIEGIITGSSTNYYNEVNGDRFNAVVAFAPKLLYMRLGENIDDAAIAGIGQTEFQNRYKALIDKLISGDNTCKVVLSTSVWNKPNFDAAMRQIASERSYPLADFSDMWPNRLNNSYYAINPSVYGNQGIDEHPDNQGMARIADDLWTKTPGTTVVTTPTDPPTPTTPPSGTYNFPTVTGIQSDAWNGYNNAISSGHNDQGRVVGNTYTFNGTTANIEIREGYGCSLQLYDKAIGRYIFNWYDWGRQSALCLYSGPKNFNQAESANESNFSSIGFNPIQPGSFANSPSPVLAAGLVTGNDGVLRHYSKIHMIQWTSGVSAQNPPRLTGVYLEQWIGLVNDAADVKTRVTMDRSDQTFYDGDIGGEAITQEYPNMMTIGNGSSNGVKTYYYVGPSPGTNDQDGKWFKQTTLVENPTTSFEGTTHLVSEPFITREYKPGRFVTLSTPRFAQTATNVYNLQEGDSDSEFSRIGSYASAMTPLIMDPRGTWYHEYAFKVTSTVQEGRTWANAKPQIHGSVPNWTFSQSKGRNDWLVHKGFDQREPFSSNNWKPTFRVVDGSTGGSALESPFVIHKANQIAKIYIRMKYSGPVGKWRIEFIRNGQWDREMDPARPQEMAARHPNGTANGGTQAFEFNVIKDGQWHTYEITTSSNSEWRDIIQRYKLKYALFQQAPNQNDGMEISYFGINNPN